MARANLASLLADTGPTPPEEAVTTAAASVSPPEATVGNGIRAGKATPSASAPERTRQAADGPGEPSRGRGSAPTAGPRYLQLERKELRLRVDQADELARLTRRLNRARRGTGERLTDNTLIRVAVDSLLERADQLDGTTEAELRKSLSLLVRD